MSRNSCIVHPAESKYVRRRDDYVGICDGNTCAAELLDLFEYWTNCKLERQREVLAFNEAASRLQQPTISLPNLWLYERIQDLKAALIEGFAETSIKKSLKLLKDKGFLEDKPSPTKFDNTRMYLFRISEVQSAINNWHKASMAESTEKLDETKTSDDQTKTTLDETNITLDETETSHISITPSITPSNNQEGIPPLSPQGEEDHPAAYGDVGSLGASTPTLQTEEVRPQLQNKPAPEEMGEHSSSESNRVITARDNNGSRPKRILQGDEFFGAVREEKRQRSFAAKMQRTVIPIEEMQPWENESTYKAFEAYLLEEAKKWKCSNPASYVAKKLQDISMGKAPKTEFEQWQAQQQPQPTKEPENSPLTPEQEAWVAIAREITTVSEGAYINITPHREFWRVVSNLAVFNGWLHEVMVVVPLSALPIRLKLWYPECYRLAKQKSPHLRLPAPLSPVDRAS
ncbi:MAG TPA: hypothetical protein V6D33_07255 [Cyanophyceae cyanobacterium]